MAADLDNARYMKRRVKPTGKIEGEHAHCIANEHVHLHSNGAVWETHSDGGHIVRFVVDYDDRCLIVHYEIEASVLDESGESMRVERKLHKKRCVERAAPSLLIVRPAHHRPFPRCSAFASSR